MGTPIKTARKAFNKCHRRPKAIRMAIGLLCPVCGFLEPRLKSIIVSLKWPMSIICMRRLAV